MERITVIMGFFLSKILFHALKISDMSCSISFCETKVWLILILMTTKQGLELMTTF